LALKTHEEALGNIKEAAELYLENLCQEDISRLKNSVSMMALIAVTLRPYG